jgi:beta-barrel assembly-enhancing protease
MRKWKLTIVIIVCILTGNCSKDDNSVNIFTVDQDMEFGAQMEAEIAKDPVQYPILDPTQNATAYQHLKRIRDKILASGKLTYANKFTWEVKIIKNDSVLNAFAAPGGYMYFYTGLIKFLDNEAQFAGVMAHEMAHADRRHSTDQLTKVYGFSVLMSILLGKQSSKMAEIAAGLAQGLSSLAFSRANEYEADAYAVKYLSATDYDPKGIAGFFIKLEAEGQSSGNIPIFLSTHPSPVDRIDKINEAWVKEGSKAGNAYADTYQQFKNSLPQ